MLKTVVVLVGVLFSTSSSALIDYAKQNEWAGACNAKDSKKQTPVDVITPKTNTEVDGKFVELSVGDGLAASNENSDNFIKIKFAKTITYKIPGLENTEGTVAQLHMHWGAKDTEGSEHWMDGKQYAAEIHLVTSYGSDGKYAVVNRFFKVGAENAQVAQMIASAEATGDKRSITGFNLTAFYPNDMKDVITYEGGLTTPTCDEIVHWVVVPEPLTISSAQLAKLRTVKLGDGTGTAVTYNWRNKQALNDRTFKHFKLKTKKSASAATLASPLLILVAVIVNAFQ